MIKEYTALPPPYACGSEFAYFCHCNKLCLVLGMFLEHKCNTGVETDKLAYEKFDEDWCYLKFKPPLGNHALMLPRS